MGTIFTRTLVTPLTHRLGRQRPAWLSPGRPALLGTLACLLSAALIAQDRAPAAWDEAVSVVLRDEMPDVLITPARGAGGAWLLNGADLAAAPTGPLAGMTGSARVAAGDVNTDGVADLVIGAGPGSPGLVTIVSGLDGSVIQSGHPFGPRFNGGLNLAVGDVNGDGRLDVLVGTGAGGRVHVYDAANAALLTEGAPYGPAFSGGIHVAAGDLDGDGRDEIVTAPATGGGVVKAYRADRTLLGEIAPYGAAFAGGVHVATGDVDGDGQADLITSPATGAEPVRVYSARTHALLHSFFPLGVRYAAGFSVAVSDLGADGRSDLIVALGPGRQPWVGIFDGLTGALQTAVLAGPVTFEGGLLVSAAPAAAPIRFTSAPSATFTAGEAGSFAVVTAGRFAGTTIGLTGTLPAGVTFTDHGDGTAMLEGTPVWPGGSYPLSFTATRGPITATQDFTLTVSAVNQPPVFAPGPNQSVAEDAGPQVVAAWATALTPGPPHEAGQSVAFEVSVDDPSLFSALPSISSDGTLTYTSAADANGSAMVTVALRDDGGTADGGVDTSAPQTFTITVTAVNDVPSFTAANHQSAEDGGPQSVANWATAISAGPANEAGQALTFIVTANTNTALFSVAPAVTPEGTLTYTAAPDAFGSADITIVLQDAGGTDGGGVDTSAPQTFTIAVTAINDVPSFTASNHQSGEDAGPQSVASWATGISVGAGDDAGQALTFIVTANTNPALFSVAPAVTPEGTLTYTAAPNVFGSADITIVLQDDGGTAGGGGDTSAPQTFTIGVTAVNDVPGFTATNHQSGEDAGPQSIANWATAISAGPANEAGQAVTFIVTANTNPALFSVAPAVTPEGTLTYTAAPNVFGSADITIVLQDDGGTAGGGVDTSAPQTFTIRITPVNDAPSFTIGPNQMVLQYTGAQTVDGWAMNMSPGPNEASQAVLFMVMSNTNAALFSDGPAVSTAGTLTYTPAAGASGTATITLVLRDNGGTADGGMDSSAPQTFTIEVMPLFAPQGGANPFGGTDIGAFSSPAFVDLDGDGDLDLLAGEINEPTLGSTRPFYYFANTGTPTNPAYVPQTGASDPFDGVTFPVGPAPTFGDLDGDGDLDAVIGEINGTVHFFLNTGTAASPTLAEQSGASNPFNGFDPGEYSTPALADIDGDGDLDAVVGFDTGMLAYFENTGTAASPAYTLRTGSDNPFAGFDAGEFSAPELGDVDGDGDLDVIVGATDGLLRYLENTGTSTDPVYVERTGAANPFNGFTVGADSSPDFGDVDGDGDLDVVIGANDGRLHFLRANRLPPIP